jgi:predicted GIY-YIG superfamily endonuclease
MQYLYRAFEGSDKLLYVGISGRWSERLHQHEKTSEWLERTDYVLIQRFDTREEVEKAEKLAIREEKPLYNKDHNQGYESVMTHFEKLKFWTLFDTPVAEDHEDLVAGMKSIVGLYFTHESKPKARHLALAFFASYSDDPEGCRNCKAIYAHKQIGRWALQADQELDAEETE